MIAAKSDTKFAGRQVDAFDQVEQRRTIGAGRNAVQHRTRCSDRFGRGIWDNGTDKASL